MTTVLVIEDDTLIRENLLELLTEEGFTTVAARDGKEGIALALAHPPDVIVCDITMPILDGHQVLRAIRDYPDTTHVPFIFLSARAQHGEVRAGMNLGADDYVTKPFTRQDLLDSIRMRLERHSVRSRAIKTPSGAPIPEDPGIIIRAPAMRELYERSVRAAQSNMSLLLLGETGVGKDVLAHAIHKASPRAPKPFIPLNCAALPENLLESELFGHEKGAFTGALSTRPGLFEAANGGTVFLDEVGDLPKTTQAKLLRVLEDHRVMRVGGRTFHEVDVRIVAATNRDLEADSADGSFRADLFYRIAGVMVTVPPLRERTEEVVALAERFATNMARQMRLPQVPTLEPGAVLALKEYSWPGNVRELRNAVEQAVTLCGANAIRLEHLPTRVRTKGTASSDPRDTSPNALLRTNKLNFERQRILEALDQCAGNQSRAAALLGISRGTLISRLAEFELPRPRKKP